MSESAKNLIKESLPKVIKSVFADEWSHTSKRYISDLLTLVAYYADDDISKEMVQGCNRLRAIILQIDELETIMERISMISNYRCDFLHDSECEVAPNYTFAPQFPNISDICIALADKTETLKKEISEIDIISIYIYIRKKAIAAGDL